MTTPQTLQDLVSIGIVTRNRWQDLQVALRRLAEAELSSIPTFIYDDGSEQPCPFDVSSLLSQVKLNRFSESSGYITRRNQLAGDIKTKYYLSLDDDSFPVNRSLQSVIEFAEKCDDLFCLSFPVYNPILKAYQNRSLQPAPYRVRTFIGCGHLLHLERFKEMGGYREELIHQGEEMEIAARAFQRGFYCYHFPNFEIHHMTSNAGRNWQRMDFYGARNNVLWNDWFVPHEIKLIKQSRTFLSRIIHSIRVRRVGQLKGEIAGLKAIAHYKFNRNLMTLPLFKQWQSLPWS